MAKPSFLSENGLTYFWSQIKNLLAGKVDKETGKGLSTNDYSTTEKDKLNNIQANAQVNAIEAIKVNGTVQAIENKTVDITVSTFDLSDRMAKGAGQNSVIVGTISGNSSNVATGEDSYAQGRRNTASGLCSHAEGYYSKATGDEAHAEGYNTTASGNYSHAEGYFSEASNGFAHAEGSSTVASGPEAHAEGATTVSSGAASHSEGWYTIANHKSQHVFGEFNIEDDSTNENIARGNYVEIVGNGQTKQNRSNARTLDWNGNEVLSGKLTVGIAPANDMDVTTKKYVDDAVDSLTQSIEGITGIDFVVVQELPETGENGIIYLVPHSHDVNDGYDEYIWINSGFEKLGCANIDLSGYVEVTDTITNAQIDSILAT